MNKLWEKFKGLPAGKALFSRALGLMIPYTGTIAPEILEFGAGKASVRLRDRRRVRNHLNSIHAVALMNVCELTSGLALTSALPNGHRIILKGYQIEYLKKARGPITTEAFCPPTSCEENQDFIVSITARDTTGDIVCRASATWQGGPAKPA